jgi:hypothetical protein
MLLYCILKTYVNDEFLTFKNYSNPFKWCLCSCRENDGYNLAARFVFYDLCHTLQLFWPSFWYTESTGCIKNTWQFLKFEKQCASYAPLSYWPSSCTVMFGVWLRWSTSQCNAELRQWNCLPKLRLLQLYTVVSVSSFKDVMLLAAILGHCGYLKKDQWRTLNPKDVHFQHLHLTMWSGYDTPCCKVHASQLGGKLSHVA